MLQNDQEHLKRKYQIGAILGVKRKEGYSIAETAKANSLKPYDYFVYLLEEIPKHMDQEDRTFLEDLLPWSEKLPEEIRKQP